MTITTLNLGDADVDNQLGSKGFVNTFSNVEQFQTKRLDQEQTNSIQKGTRSGFSEDRVTISEAGIEASTNGNLAEKEPVEELGVIANKFTSPKVIDDNLTKENDALNAEITSNTIDLTDAETVESNVQVEKSAEELIAIAEQARLEVQRGQQDNRIERRLRQSIERENVTNNRLAETLDKNAIQGSGTDVQKDAISDREYEKLAPTLKDKVFERLPEKKSIEEQISIKPPLFEKFVEPKEIPETNTKKDEKIQQQVDLNFLLEQNKQNLVQNNDDLKLDERERLFLKKNDEFAEKINEIKEEKFENSAENSTRNTNLVADALMEFEFKKDDNLNKGSTIDLMA